ncbi:MAG TPA: hypothetical protein DD462_13015 [Leeuwenhoekiella sp.]|nr:hypothetical protein [Leeuwenhoekiella sp.]
MCGIAKISIESQQTFVLESDATTGNLIEILKFRLPGKDSILNRLVLKKCIFKIKIESKFLRKRVIGETHLKNGNCLP